MLFRRVLVGPLRPACVRLLTDGVREPGPCPQKPGQCQTRLLAAVPWQALYCAATKAGRYTVAETMGHPPPELETEPTPEPTPEPCVEPSADTAPVLAPEPMPEPEADPEQPEADTGQGSATSCC